MRSRPEGPMSWLAVARIDAEFLYELSGRPLPRDWIVRSLLSPSLRAPRLFRLAARTRGFAHVLVRSHMLRSISCDVSSGVRFEGALYIPHPVGIVIGAGAVVGRRVSIFHHVTIGRDGREGYPTIGSESILYTGCLIIGPTTVAAGSRIGAYRIVSADVPRWVRRTG